MCSKKPIIRINTVIFEKTYLYLEQMINIAEELGIKHIGFVHSWSVSEQVGLQHASLFRKLFNCEASSWKGFVDISNIKIDLDKLSKIIDQIDKFRRKNHQLEIKFVPEISSVNLKQYYTDPRFCLGKKRCSSPWRKIDIKPNGNVAFCMDYPDYIIGNVRDNSLRSIWNNERARNFRKALMKFNKFPICTRCCQLYIC